MRLPLYLDINRIGTIVCAMMNDPPEIFSDDEFKKYGDMYIARVNNRLPRGMREYK